MSDEELLRFAWETGALKELLLRPDQFDLLDQVLKKEFRRFVFHCSRRYGKTYILLSICEILARQKDPVLIRYAAQTQKAVNKMIKPNFRIIEQTCPDDLKIRWIKSEGLAVFKNGSEFHIGGADTEDHIDNLRGTGADIYIVDEASFITKLDYLVNDVLHPQTLTTNGIGIISSSSPISPAHPFTSYINKAKKVGAYFKKTIYDNKSLSDKTIEEFKVEAETEGKGTWEREYLCELIIDENKAIVPEFYKNKSNIVKKEIERPRYFDAYESADLGVVHNTHVLFAYWDFLRAKLVIDDELVFNRKTTKFLADGIKQKETELGFHQVYKRLSDTDQQVIIDLNEEHGLNFIGTLKDNLLAQINSVRLAFNRGEIEINERCRILIRDLEGGIWNKNKTKFEEIDDGSHCDGIAALIYLYRNLDKSKNPYPVVLETDWHYNHIETRNKDADTLALAFKGRRG